MPEIEAGEHFYVGLQWREGDAGEPREQKQVGLGGSQQRRVKKVKGFVDEFTTPTEVASREDVVTYAAEKGLDREAVQDTIDDLLEKGELVQRESGKLSLD